MAPFRIDATDGTNVSGGGNTGIDFFGTLSVSPAAGGVGTLLTISNTGSGFFGPMTVTIGGVAATDITVVSQQQLTCKIAAGTPTGPQDLVVTNPDSETQTLSGAVVVASGASGRPTLRLATAGWLGF